MLRAPPLSALVLVLRMAATCVSIAALQELRKQTSKCPICRNHVDSLLHIKMHKAATKAGTRQPQGAAAEAIAAKIEDLKV